MKKYFILVVGFCTSMDVLASKCAASFSILNDSSESRTISFCLEFDPSKLDACDYPMKYEFAAGEKKDVLLNYMCGYSSDPKLEEYWVLYQVSGSSVYKNKKYKKNLIIQ